MKLAEQKNHLGSQILYRRPDTGEKRRHRNRNRNQKSENIKSGNTTGGAGTPPPQGGAASGGAQEPKKTTSEITEKMGKVDIKKNTNTDAKSSSEQ